MLAAPAGGPHSLTNLLVGLATVVVAVARKPATRRAGASASDQVTLRQAASPCPRLGHRLQAEWGAALRDAYQVCTRIQLAAKGPRPLLAQVTPAQVARGAPGLAHLSKLVVDSA